MNNYKKVISKIIPILLIGLQGCFNPLKKKVDESALIDPGNLTSTNYCSHSEATNYNPNPNGAAGSNENCKFLACIDETKIGYNKKKLDEYKDYVASHGGMIIESDNLCGDDNIDYNGADFPFPAGYTEYHTYKEFITKIKEYINSSNGFAKLVVFGKSAGGLPLIALRLSNDHASANQKPTLVMVGTHHSREHLSTEIPLRLIGYMIEKAKQDSAFKALFTSRTVIVAPLLNPDGAIYDLSATSFRYWRKNTRKNAGSSSYIGVDLNRNYDQKWAQGGSSSNPGSDVYHGPNAFSEPETVAFRDFLQTLPNLKFALSYHAFSELVLYPWGGESGPVPGKDGAAMKKIAQELAKMTKYTAMQSSALYIATGDTCDWTYAKLHAYCLTFELSPTESAGNAGFYPKGNIIESVFNKHKPPIDYLLSILPDPSGVIK